MRLDSIRFNYIRNGRIRLSVKGPLGCFEMLVERNANKKRKDQFQNSVIILLREGFRDSGPQVVPLECLRTCFDQMCRAFVSTRGNIDKCRLFFVPQRLKRQSTKRKSERREKGASNQKVDQQPYKQSCKLSSRSWLQYTHSLRTSADAFLISQCPFEYVL